MSSLSPEDLPPDDPTERDRLMRRQLEISTSRHFFAACPEAIQALLGECGWTVSVDKVLILAIHCPNASLNWRILNRINELAEPLAQFSQQAKIRVYPPLGTGSLFELRVDEQSELRDPNSDGRS